MKLLPVFVWTMKSPCMRTCATQSVPPYMYTCKLCIFMQNDFDYIMSRLYYFCLVRFIVYFIEIYLCKYIYMLFRRKCSLVFVFCNLCRLLCCWVAVFYLCRGIIFTYRSDRPWERRTLCQSRQRKRIMWCVCRESCDQWKSFSTI